MPFRSPGFRWVDGTTAILERGDTRDIQDILVDQRTYYQGILRVDVPDGKIQHRSTTDGHPLRSPTAEAVARHVGRA